MSAKITDRDKHQVTEILSAGTRHNPVKNESTNQLQSAGVWISFDVVPHVSVRHPFRHHAEGRRCLGDSKERNDVGMGNSLPRNRRLIKDLVVCQLEPEDTTKFRKLAFVTFFTSSVLYTRSALIAIRLSL